MGYNDVLWNLLQNGMIDRNAPVATAIIGAIGAQLDSQHDQTVQVINNMSPATSDAAGIAQWEIILQLPAPDPNMTLLQRQQRAMAKAYRLTGALKKWQLQNILNSYSPGKTATVQTKPSTYQVWGTFQDDVPDWLNMVAGVYRVLPAHLQFIAVFNRFANTEPVSTEASGIFVGRSVYANMGGPNATGEVLDGSWRLDGSQVLDGSWQAGPAITVTKDLTWSTDVPISGYTEEIGFILDGGRKLDGSWALSGTTEQVIPIRYQKSLVVGLNVEAAGSASNEETITVSRIANLRNLKILNGSWQLDGSQTLNQAPPTTTTSSEHISVGIVVPIAQHTEQVGYFLDGHRTLDGSWQLSGTTTKTMTIGASVTVNGVPA